LRNDKACKTAAMVRVSRTTFKASHEPLFEWFVRYKSELHLRHSHEALFMVIDNWFVRHEPRRRDDRKTKKIWKDLLMVVSQKKPSWFGTT